MTKLMTAALAAAALAVTAFAGSGAEAAFNVRIAAPQGLSMLEKTGCHGGGYYVPRHRYRIVRHSVKPKVQVVHVRKSEPETVAKIEDPKPKSAVVPTPEAAAPSPAADNNSTITPAEETASGLTDNKTAGQILDSGQATTNDKVEAKSKNVDEEKLANKDLGCKAFFPAIGMTLTVPCK